jgi:hypothetical protein
MSATTLSKSFAFKQYAVVWSTAPLARVERAIIEADLALGRKPDIPGVRVFLCDTPQEAAELEAALK